MRFPIAPLLALAAGRDITTNAELARVLGVTRRTVQRWHTTGLTDAAADAAAVALGVLPGDVWAAWDEMAPVECPRHRRQQRAWRRHDRRRRRNPAWRAQQNAARAARYHANKAAELARQKEYDRANREAILEKRRLHYQANRERILARTRERYWAEKEAS